MSIFNYFNLNRFYKKPKQVEPIKLYIPEDQIDEVAVLFDKSISNSHSMVADRKFWLKIVQIFPDNDFANKSWSFRNSPLRPYVVCTSK